MGGHAHTQMLLPLSYLWMNILAHLSKACWKCLDWQSEQRDRGETQRKRRPSWNAKLHKTVYCHQYSGSLRGTHLFISFCLSLPIHEVRGFFVSLCVMECTHCSPLEIKLHEMSIWNKLWRKKKKRFKVQPELPGRGSLSGGGEWDRRK